jgi:hypothetical protein
MYACCTKCGRSEMLGTRVMGKLAFVAGTALLGSRATKKHPLLMLALGVGGALLGHWVDTKILPNCPTCRVALKAVNTLT